MEDLHTTTMATSVLDLGLVFNDQAGSPKPHFPTLSPFDFDAPLRLMTAGSVLIVAVMGIGSIFAQSAVGTNVQAHALWV